MANKISELLTIKQAAKQVRMSGDRLRPICINAGIAVRWGGTEKHPWIKVRLEDVERVLLSRRVMTPEQKPPRRFSGKLDPAVKC